MTRTNKAKSSKDLEMTFNEIPALTVKSDISVTLPRVKIATILGAIDNNISTEANIIHVTSAYNREGSEQIAFETALFAASQNGKNVIFININPGEKSIANKAGLNPDISLDQFVLDGMTGKAPLMHIEGTSFVYTKLEAEEQNANLLYNTRQLKEVLAYFKTSYDLIIIHSKNAIQSGTAATFAPLSDSSIIVIKADRTRQPVVRELIDIITNSGGKIAGTVMSGRRYYIPKWVYKLFFNADSRD